MGVLFLFCAWRPSFVRCEAVSSRGIHMPDCCFRCLILAVTVQSQEPDNLCAVSSNSTTCIPYAVSFEITFVWSWFFDAYLAQSCVSEVVLFLRFLGWHVPLWLARPEICSAAAIGQLPFIGCLTQRFVVVFWWWSVDRRR